MVKNLAGKVAEFFHHGRPYPATKKLEMIELLRTWMEETKDTRFEALRYQVFEFMFDFSSNRPEYGRLDFLFNLISYSISTTSTKMLEAAAIWIKGSGVELNILNACFCFDKF